MQLKSAENSDYMNIRALWEECFPEDSDAWRDWYFKYIYRPKNTIALFDSSIPISMAQINEYNLQINGKTEKAFALAGVATSESFRRQGFADKIIRESLKKMYARNASFSFLYPFNYDFYTRYGYAISYSKCTVYREPDENIIDSYTVSKSYTIDDLLRLYNKHAENLNGYVKRSKEYFKVKLHEYTGDNYDIELVYRDGVPAAYYIGREEEGVYNLDEFAYDDNYDNVLIHIANYKRMPVKAAVPARYGLKGNIYPHCMGRVINFKALFCGVRCGKCSLKLRIEDDIIIENSGVWEIHDNNGLLSIEKSIGNCDMEIKINDLAAVVTGAKEYVSEDIGRLNEIIFGGKNRLPWIIEVC